MYVCAECTNVPCRLHYVTIKHEDIGGVYRAYINALVAGVHE